MAFIEDARRHVKEVTLSDLDERLAREEYINRLLLREGASAEEALTRYRLWGDAGHDVVEDRHLEREPHLVLIGNAGAGKSLTLTFACLQALGRFLENPSAPVPFFLDLGTDLPSNLSIQSALDSRYQGLFLRSLAEHPPGCSLFLDALDETLRHTPFFINDLESFLQEHWSRWAQVALTCRRAIWRPDWFSRDPVKLTVYHADYLGDEVYAQILPDVTVRGEFFRQCRALGISALLETPFDGLYLAREFRAGRPLPRTRRDCVSQRIGDALQGTERDRREGRAPPVDRLRFLASQLACLASFTRHGNWSPQEATDLLGSSRVLRSDQSVDPEEMRVLLHRPLFRKTGERFSFTHQLYQEFLTAGAIARLPLRKQRQLLEAELPGLHRIRTPHRGIAVFLAEGLSTFARHLIQSDPLIAFLAEMPSLPQEEDEALLRSVLDNAISGHRAPWWEIPPRGERPISVLPMHRPRDVATFLRPYLEHSEEIARLWGTACAEAWGSVEGLINVLGRLAHDPSQHVEIRTSAIGAIGATGNIPAVRALYDLFDDGDDRVRGEVLRAYREVERPAPPDLITRLRGGSRDPLLLCRLQLEAETFGLALGPAQLAEAFRAVEEEFETLRDLRVNILMGLFRRATELRFSDIPPGVVVKSWLAQDSAAQRHEKLLTQLLREHHRLFDQVWDYIMDLLGRDDGRISEHLLAERLAESCTDRIFELVPPIAEGLNRFQELFLSDVLARHFWKEPTADRLTLFHARAQVFTRHLRLPRRRQPPPNDPLEERWKLAAALQQAEDNPISQTWNLLWTIAEIEHGSRRREQPTREDVVHVLSRAGPVVSRRIFQVFRNCVMQLQYEHRRTDPSGFSVTNTIFEIPFWVLRERGENFHPQKIAEIICCYGFLSHAESGRYEGLLEELRAQHRDTWERCIWRLLEGRDLPVDWPLRYLSRISDPIYIARCSERLRRGLFNRIDFGSLLDYLVALRREGCAETLRSCYCLLRDRLREREERRRQGGESAISPGDREQLVEDQLTGPSDLGEFPYWDQFRPLLVLMGDDDDWAWAEFAERLRQEEVPLDDEDILRHRPSARLPRSPRRLSVLADWYALVRRKMRQNDLSADALARSVLETIIQINGEEAMRELRRLVETNAFPNARWLSHAILAIEDRMLSEGTSPWGAGALLDFINRENLGVVLSERDLFEWVCRAVEEVQDALELRGEAVAGFWSGDQPKTEPECQNVLWPFLRLTLERYGIPVVEAEEKFVGPNRCDFWAEYARPHADSFRVGIELKTARVSYGPGDLLDPVETQLVEQYLRPAGCRHGIYVVLWFRDDTRYTGPTHWHNRDSLLRQLQERCEAVSKSHRVSLAPYAIDLTARHRRR